jgi:ElaB/YqjD/DUF883 family membrane-anchored ribosome-binding protein
MNTNSQTTSTRIKQFIKSLLDIGKKSPQERSKEWAWIKQEYKKEYRQVRRKVRIEPEKYLIIAAGIGLLLGASLGKRNKASKKIN